MADNIKNFVSWLGVLGIPTIFAMTLGCVRACILFSKKVEILIESQQAQMRRDLLVDYNTYMEHGWVSEDDMKIWEDNYQKYHALGANGVMDARRQKLLALPTQPPKKRRFRRS